MKIGNFFWKFGHPNRFLPLELIIGGDKTGCLLLLQSELSQAFIIIIQSLYVVASGVWPCCHTQPTCCLPKRFLSTGYPLSTSTYSSSVISPNVALTAEEQYSTEIWYFLTNFTTLTRQTKPSFHTVWKPRKIVAFWHDFCFIRNVFRRFIVRGI